LIFKEPKNISKVDAVQSTVDFTGTHQKPGLWGRTGSATIFLMQYAADT
jgi:hypothetical protein